jgi:hypothetical protein
VDAVARYNLIDVNSDIVRTARGLGMCLGD